MDEKIFLALIAGGVSLLVAIISLIATVINSRVSGKTARDMEEFRQSFAKETKKHEISDAEFLEVLNVLMLALQAIQKMKDEILLIINSYADSLNAGEALLRLSAARDGLFSTYEKDHGRLNSMEMNAYHAAKNIALHTVTLLQVELKSKEYASEICHDMDRNLEEQRSRLSDCQQVLRDARTDRIINRTIR